MTKSFVADNECPQLIAHYQAHVKELYCQFKLQYTLALYGLQGAMDGFNNDPTATKYLSLHWMKTRLSTILYSVQEDFEDDVVLKISERLGLTRHLYDDAQRADGLMGNPSSAPDINRITEALKAVGATDIKVTPIDEAKATQADLITQLFERVSSKKETH